MLATGAKAIVLLAAAGLIGLGVWMAARPRDALAALARMGGAPAVHLGEMSVRILIGAAFAAAADASRFPVAMTAIGGFLIVSAVILLLLPRRWHAAYSTFWAARIPVAAVRLIGPLSWAMGAGLIWVCVWGPAP